VVYNNMKEFCSNKKKSDDIFDMLTTQSLNDHLKSLMDGLTAKVFRTFNASLTLQNELCDKKEEDVSPDALVSEKMLFYNRANREVAILCNHQRAAPKTFDAQMEKLVERDKEIREQRDELMEYLDEVTGKRRNKKVKKEQDHKKEQEHKLTNGQDHDKPKLKSKDPEKIKRQIDRLNIRLKDFESKIALKSDMKTVALTTSRINYMDPRITVAWCKSKEVPIEKIFSKALLTKFPWAMEVPSNWRF